MKIVNRTHWKTAHLRKLAMEAAKRELTVEQRKRMTVNVIYSRSGPGQHSGYAYYNSNSICVRIPKEGAEPWKVAYLCIHEYAHARGYRHKDLRGLAKYDWRKEKCAEWYEWAKDFPLEQAPLKKKRKDDHDKLAHYQKLVKQWESKLKRAQNAIRKHGRKVAYYERKIHGSSSKD